MLIRRLRHRLQCDPEHLICIGTSATLSARLLPEARTLISALLTLVAWARAPHAGQRVVAETPVCGERGGQLIIGAQTTSLAAHAVERLWSAPLNDHKKLILFSDSVQDAAHRAGYIESKTGGHLMRAGLARAIATLPPVLPWDQALDAFGRCYLDLASPLALPPRDFVARFIPPSMEWLRDWRELQARGDLPAGSRLPEMIAQRMQWRAVEELAHRSDRGRTLSRVGIAVLFPDPAELQALAHALTLELRQAGGGLERLREEQVLHWTTGTVLALIRAGAIFHLGLEQLAETGDFKGFEFAPQRRHWLPHRGRFDVPRFISRDPGRHGFLHLEERDGNAAVFAIADASPDGHDQYYFANPLEMLHGDVEAPAIYLNAAEVLRRQIYAFFFDHWVAEESPSLPDRLGEALDQVAKMDGDTQRFPFNYLDFVNRNELVLFAAFCRMLGVDLRPETRAKLEKLVTGTEREKNLRARFLASFEETHAERESWKARRKALNAELGRLRKRPQDEQTQAEIDLLEKERAGLGQRTQQLNAEYLLEAMTNAGLLPNYAFPEEGVALTTVIHGSNAGGQEYSVPVHRYTRPAHAALAELAPHNTFFAHKSKVEIDQIDLGVEPPPSTASARAATS